MRILWIKTELLHPVDKGGKIRTYQMLRALVRNHHVTYLCLDDGTAGANALAQSQEYAQDLITVPFVPPAKGSYKYIVALLRNILSPLPYAIARYQSVSLQVQVAKLAPTVELVVCDFLTPAVNIDQSLQSQAVLFQHNVEAMIWGRRAQVPQSWLRRAYMRLQAQRMTKFETAMCRGFRHVVAVSADDAEVFRRDYAVGSVSHVATGVDLEYFAPAPGVRRNAMELVFVGSMDWMPNDEGIRWFIGEVLGLVRKRIADVRLTIVGRSPTTALRASIAGQPNVEITGTVDDVRPYLARAALSVVPLRIGGGTRLKIYEAMAMGVPIVSTHIGAEGLPVQDGEHLLLVDSPEAQSAAIIKLLQQPGEAARIADNARNFVQLNCSWDAVAAQFVANCSATRLAM